MGDWWNLDSYGLQLVFKHPYPVNQPFKCDLKMLATV